MKLQDYAKQYLNMLAVLTLTAPLILMTAGCDEIDTGDVQNSVPLPMDSVLNFRCENEGVFPDDCVLDNPENPYAKVVVTEDNKFELNDDAPSPKSRYYLWATALAKGAGIPGENQYYTAVSLQEVFAESGSPTTREQAIKAYRSVLDNFFFSPTFFVIEDLTEGDVAFAAPIKDLVGRNLYDPASIPESRLVPLYREPLLALEAISEWGYIYDPDLQVMSFFE